MPAHNASPSEGPITERCTFMEVVRPLGGGEPARQAMRELETLLYTSA